MCRSVPCWCVYGCVLSVYECAGLCCVVVQTILCCWILLLCCHAFARRCSCFNSSGCDCGFGVYVFVLLEFRISALLLNNACSPFGVPRLCVLLSLWFGIACVCACIIIIIVVCVFACIVFVCLG